MHSTARAPARWWQSFFYRLICFIGSQDNSGWKGSHEAIQSSFLLKTGSFKRSDEVTQGFIQFPLENIQEGRLYNLSGLSAPLLGCPYCENLFHYAQSEPLLFELISVFSCSSLHITLRRTWTHHLVSLWVGAGELRLYPFKAISSPG